VTEPAAERTTNEEAEISPKPQMNNATDSNIEVSVVTLRSPEAIRRLVEIGVRGRNEASRQDHRNELRGCRLASCVFKYALA